MKIVWIEGGKEYDFGIQPENKHIPLTKGIHEGWGETHVFNPDKLLLGAGELFLFHLLYIRIGKFYKKMYFSNRQTYFPKTFNSR